MAAKTFRQFKAEIQKLIRDDIVKKKNMKIIGDEAVELIQRRTRLGKGTDTNDGPETKLTPLSAIYRQRRRLFKREGILSGTTAPNKSNLTLTGQMLASLFSTATKGKITITQKGDFNKLKAAVHEEGVPSKGIPKRSFMHLSSKQIRSLNRTIRSIIQKTLDDAFN